MKKALVFYLYGNRNAGDMAICLGAIELLKKQNYEIIMVSRFSEAEDEYWKSRDYLAEYYPDVKVYPGPFSFERDTPVVKKMLAYGVSALKAAGIIRDQQIKRLIEETDVVFFNGGNLLRAAGLTDYLRLAALFYPIKKAYALKKPIYCLPQSTAKISGFGEKILRRCLEYFESVFVREEISYVELKKRFPNISFHRSTDLAFLCRDTDVAANKYTELGLDVAVKTNAIVIRNTGIGDIGELDVRKQQRLKEALFRYIKNHPDQHYMLVVQTEKDREYSELLLKEIREIADAQIVENHDPLVLREIYKHVELLITMRLHAGILALSALTPVIGLFSEEWGLKNPGIMKDYEMPYCLIEKDMKERLELLTYVSNGDIGEKIWNYTEIMNDMCLKLSEKPMTIENARE